jgi:hypothetical protein
MVALDNRARRLRRCHLLHTRRKGVRGAARAAGHRARARVYGGRRGGRCCPLRPAVPVLRDTDRTCRTPANDPTGNHPGYGAARDDSVAARVPDGIANGLPERLTNGLPDCLTFRICDSIAVRAFQLVSTRRLAPSLVSSSASRLRCCHWRRTRPRHRSFLVDGRARPERES